ncbi:MAG: hypothetical protein IJY97_01380 [Clostridia bacterium]|nr:hypothetical protein [Clostridia bacterium]
MNTKIKNIVNVVVFCVAVFGFALLCLVLPKPEFLDSERRPAATFPTLSLESIMKDGLEYGDSFMKQFDDKYTPDNFPFRDFFRNLKSFVNTNVFNKSDKDGVYVVDGVAAEMQEQIDKDSIAHAAEKLTFIYEKFLKDKGIKPYMAIIPDKGYFLSEANGYLSMDYDAFIAEMLASVEFMEYINIKDSLEVGDYYASDTHWRQEQLVKIAEILVNAMGGNYDSKFEKNELDVDFYGVYAGRAPKPLDAETIYYLTNGNLENVKVTDWEHGGKEISLYDMEKAHGKDAYDMFLSGELSKVTIENPNAKTDRELVVFRDSYGRSLLPLMVEDYAKITVIDIRYQIPQILLMGVNFENADVLFLYSTLILNNSSELK